MAVEQLHLQQPAIDRSVAMIEVTRIDAAGGRQKVDMLAVEEPLDIRLCRTIESGRDCRSISITMRTPGHDRELAAGFLFSEGIIAGPDEVSRIHCCRSGNVVRVDLAAGVQVDLRRLERNFYTSSSCGVCGKTSLAAVQVVVRQRLTAGWPIVEPATICQLPAKLRSAQALFDRTGGLHAAALFDSIGNLLTAREDVGRHNALDKLIGGEFLSHRLPLSERILLVSGRASFELVQKAAVAGIPILAAVGAPSSLAIEMAQAQGLTVLGFVREEGFNIYTDTGRVAFT